MLALDLHINARGAGNRRKRRGAQVSSVILTNDAAGRIGIACVYAASLLSFCRELVLFPSARRRNRLDDLSGSERSTDGGCKLASMRGYGRDYDLANLDRYRREAEGFRNLCTACKSYCRSALPIRGP